MPEVQNKGPQEVPEVQNKRPLEVPVRQRKELQQVPGRQKRPQEMLRRQTRLCKRSDYSCNRQNRMLVIQKKCWLKNKL